LPDQMPGPLPLDPRNIAAMEQRWLFVDRLRADRVLEIGPTRTPHGQPGMVALMEHTFDNGHKNRYRCEFVSARSYQGVAPAGRPRQVLWHMSIFARPPFVSREDREAR
jgi:hypothetical protein